MLREKENKLVEGMNQGASLVILTVSNLGRR